MADKTSGPVTILAIITPLGSSATFPKPQPPGQPGAPDHTLPGELPRPSHPIYYPLPPGAPVDPSYGIPSGEHPDQGLPGGSPPRPDQGLPKPPAQPGVPTHPISGVGEPSHPIVLPPDQGGWGPIYIWGGGPGARPPIAIPPEGETDDGDKVKYVPIWTPTTGWVSIGIVLPEGDHVTPSQSGGSKTTAVPPKK